MFKKKHKYQVIFAADGSSVIVEGYDIFIWDDDNDPTKGDICIAGSKANNDVAWFRKETLKYIAEIYRQDWVGHESPKNTDSENSRTSESGSF